MNNAITKYQDESKQVLRVRLEVRVPPLLPICSVSRCTSSI